MSLAAALTCSYYARCVRRLGVYDPLNLLAEPVEYPRRSYRRYVELEIKHGQHGAGAFFC